MSGFFYNLGRQIGRQAIPTIRKSKWIWQGVAGTDEEALRAEAALGNDLAAELRTTLQLRTQDPLQQLVDDICARLARCLKDNRRAFQADLFGDPLPNAMALPGGFIFLSDSMVELCGRDPNEVAFVLGHEMAHVIRKHAWDRILNEAALRVASTVTSRLGPLGGWLRQEGIVLLRSAHSKNCELEADEFGYRLAQAAGFSPAGAIALLQRIYISYSQHSELGQYLSSHPPPLERVVRLQGLPQPSPGAAR